MPVPQSNLVQYPEEITAFDEQKLPPFSIRDIYKETETPLTNGEIKTNDFMKYKLLMENTRLRNKNRRLRSSIRKLKAENNKMSQQSTVPSDAKRSSIVLTLLQQSLQKSQEQSEMELREKDNEIKDLRVQLQALEKEKSLMETSMALYKRLQSQHSGLSALHEKTLKIHKEEKANLVERQQSLKHRIHRYRTESRKLIQKSIKIKKRNSYLESLIQSQEALQHQPPKQSIPSNTMSPLMLAFAAHQQTCPSSSKFRSQVKLLKVRLRGETSQTRKLEQEVHLKSIALEKLYNTMGEMSNYAICLGQQLKMTVNERAKDPVGFCRSTSNEDNSSGTSLTPPQQLPQCTYHINGTLAVDFTSLNITVKGFKDTTNYKLQILSDRKTPAVYFNSSIFTTKPITLAPSCDKCQKVDDLTSNPNVTFGPKFVPAYLYTHVMSKNVRAQREISSRKVEFASLLKTISANNRTLDVSRKETENAENRLVVATRELKRLRKEKKDLNQRLQNVTSELKKKPTMKQCLDSALNTEELLKKVNGTRAYKKASKMAQKVQKATNDAWDKFKNFMNKFGEFDEQSAHESHEFGKRDHREARKSRRFHRHMKPEKRNKDYEFDEDDDHDAHENHHEFRKSSRSKAKKRESDDDHENHREFKRAHESENQKWKKRDHHESREHKKEKEHELDDDDDHSEFRKKEKNHRESHEHKEVKIRGPEAKKKHNMKNKDKFFGAERPIPEVRLENSKRKSEREDDEHDDDDEEKMFFDRRYQKKENKNKRRGCKRGNKDSKFERPSEEKRSKRQQRKDESRAKKSRNQQRKKHRWGKRAQCFQEIIGNHVNMAKEAGKKVVTSLMPIYDKWQKVYCDIEKQILPKSFSEIWESLSNDDSMRNVEYGPVYERVEESPSSAGWGWGMYRNFTDLIAPVIHLPRKIEFPSWDEDLETQTEFSEDKIVEEDKEFSDDDDIDDYVELLFEDDEPTLEEDSQWFANMFKGRESLRKDWGDSPLSEEEFDWFLKMFEGREELRKSGDSYPSNHGNDDELDWFLKMFEARAQLRFENKLEEKNWYLKMSEARNKARSEVNYEGSEVISWYEKMSKARENLRKQQEQKGYDVHYKKKQGKRQSQQEDHQEEWCQA